MSDSDERFVAVVSSGLRLAGGSVATIAIYGNQPEHENRFNKTRRRGMIIADDVPDLLRTVADLYEQEGGWKGIADAVAFAKVEGMM